MVTIKAYSITIFSLSILFFSCIDSEHHSETTSKKVIVSEKNNPHLLIGDKNFLTDYNPTHPDGDINVVIEIPTGTVDKWEVEKEHGHIIWEIRNNKPRKINYIGYPGNYGMIPKTLLPYELGGDGDPLDVIVLGPSVERGSVVKAKLIGVLNLLDNGEQDDKLIAVMEGSSFYNINSINELNTQFNGVSIIIETFFSNYKGPGKMKSLGIKGKKEAKKILDYSIKEYNSN